MAFKFIVLGLCIYRRIERIIKIVYKSNKKEGKKQKTKKDENQALPDFLFLLLAFLLLLVIAATARATHGNHLLYAAFLYLFLNFANFAA